MFDAKSLFDQFLGGSAAQGGQSGLDVDTLLNKGKEFLSQNGTGLAVGGLAGLLLGTKTGRSIGGKALTYGGLAAVAGLAYNAYQKYQDKQEKGVGGEESTQLSSIPAGSGFDPVTAPGGENAVAVTLLVAMISAAKADGHIDQAEQKRIFDKIDEVGLDNGAKAFLMDELRSPLDLDKIVASAVSPELATQIYAVSRLAIDPDHPAEKAYLNTLADRLNLEPLLIAEIEQSINDQKF